MNYQLKEIYTTYKADEQTQEQANKFFTKIWSSLTQTNENQYKLTDFRIKEFFNEIEFHSFVPLGSFALGILNKRKLIVDTIFSCKKSNTIYCLISILYLSNLTIEVESLGEKTILEKLLVALIIFYQLEDYDFIPLESKHKPKKSYLHGNVINMQNGSWCLIIEDNGLKMQMKIYLNIIQINNNSERKSDKVMPNIIKKYPFSIQHLQRMIDLLNFKMKNSPIYQALFLIRLWRLNFVL